MHGSSRCVSVNIILLLTPTMHVMDRNENDIYIVSITEQNQHRFSEPKIFLKK